MTKQQIIKIVISVLIAALTALGAAFGLSSCNVTRTITTKSEYWQKADTSYNISTLLITNPLEESNMRYFNSANG